jgi:hypothetical protein
VFGRGVRHVSGGADGVAGEGDAVAGGVSYLVVVDLQPQCLEELAGQRFRKGGDVDRADGQGVEEFVVGLATAVSP